MCVEVCYLGFSKIICYFDLFGDIDEYMCLFSNTYSSKPLLELHCTVRKTGAEGGAKKGDELSMDQVFVIGICFCNAYFEFL